MTGKPPFDSDKLRFLMDGKRIDLMLISTRHNVRYFTDGYYYPLYMWSNNTKETQYLPFIAVPNADMNAAFFIGRPGEKSVLEEQEVWITECHESSSVGTKSAAEKASEIIKSKNLDKGRIGVELSSLPADAFEILKSRLPDVTFIEAADIMDSLRAVKTSKEIEIIRKGTLLNLEALEYVLGSQEPGVTTSEIADEVAGQFRLRGLHYLYSLVCAGPSFFRAASAKRRWEENQILHIDAGALTEGYVVELCRTASLGKFSETAKKMLNGCFELEDYVLSKISHGKQASELQKNADAFLLNHPLGASGKFTAHGIGLVHHEKPVIGLQSEETLEAGMVISIETEFKNKEVGHVKIEDMVIITGNGCELISSGSKPPSR